MLKLCKLVGDEEDCAVGVCRKNSVSQCKIRIINIET